MTIKMNFPSNLKVSPLQGQVALLLLEAKESAQVLGAVAEVETNSHRRNANVHEAGVLSRWRVELALHDLPSPLRNTRKVTLFPPRTAYGRNSMGSSGAVCAQKKAVLKRANDVATVRVTFHLKAKLCVQLPWLFRGIGRVS